MEVTVLRLGHRYVRDDRVTTHLFLAARALGADSAVYSGRRDPRVEASVLKVGSNWGGDFEVRYEPSWATVIEDKCAKGWKVVHLTMYGVPLQCVINEIRASPSGKLVVVGGAKVPKEVYGLANWNVAVTNQPHSEISALSVFLHELFGGEELSRIFSKARLEIVPRSSGKHVRRMALAQGSG